MDWTKKAREFLEQHKFIQAAHIASFASEVERLTRQAQSQALQQLAELTSADVYTPHGMYDDMRCFFCGADEGMDHKDDCTWILARSGVAVASSQGGEQ